MAEKGDFWGKENLAVKKKKKPKTDKSWKKALPSDYTDLP